jgi:hypothetical protein
MTDDYIGWWGIRPGGLWHLVQSEVTDRLVMRCGRQMRMQNKGGALSFAVSPEGERCEQCVGRIVAD